MATTRTPSGQLSLSALMRTTFSGDKTGSEISKSLDFSKLFGSGSSEIAITGWLYGEPVCAAGDWLMAHASDPFGSMGDAEYSTGFTVAGSKLKALIIWNQDSTQSITVARKSSNGLPIFDAASDAITIQPGGILCLVFPTGTAALTTTSNDGLTIAVSGGTPTAKVLAAYGS